MASIAPSQGANPGSTPGCRIHSTDKLTALNLLFV